MLKQALVFLYPIQPYIDSTVDFHRGLVTPRVTATMLQELGCSEENITELLDRHPEQAQIVRNLHRAHVHQILLQCYAGALNRTISERYRDRAFHILWTTFQDLSPSPVVDVDPADQLIHLAAKFTDFTTPNPDGSYNYPDLGPVLEATASYDQIVVTGFHRGDCVDRTAEAIHATGKQVLVDEELTENLPRIQFSKQFRPPIYPSVLPSYLDPDADEEDDRLLPMIQRRRYREQQAKPWLYQWPIKLT
ncbi:hypothetical protein KA517_02985 [Candidatus Gracilibacteria bacterium]|nr:hypothetical protein [Candidatus Gracilibacteria bacterium]